MSDDQRRKRWTATLDEAGLLDEIDDQWILPGEEPRDGATVRVEEREPEPGEDESSETGARAPRADSLPPRGEGVQRALDHESGAAKRTMIGIPHSRSSYESIEVEEEGDGGAAGVESRRTTPAIPSSPGGEEQREERAGERDEDETPVVAVRGRMISVPPSPEENVSQAVIVDEPPEESGPQFSERETMGAKPRHRRSLEGGEGKRRTGDDRGEMSDRYDAGDYSGALEIAERILSERSDDEQALRIRDQCRQVLLQMYEARMGSPDHVPEVSVAQQDLIWRNLDSATGFLLSRIDGFSTFEDIIDVSGMPRFEACRIIDRLLQDGIIE
ncbi:MAG: hypothetical protein R6V85_08510 [Polyangia bacterium]